MNLLEQIAALEVLPDQLRFEWILDRLKQENIQTEIHRYRSGKNIIVEATKGPFIGIGSHFDTVPQTPGANDNASALVVSLEIARRQKTHPLKNLGVQIFFFDEEEKGLLGSTAWIQDHGLADMQAFLNMEMVGSGDQIAIWPVKEYESFPLLTHFEDLGKDKGIKTHRIDRIVMNTADHESFSLAGLADTFTISCICEKDLEVAAHYYKALEFNVSAQTLHEIVSQAPIFEHYHQASDLSKHLNEASLQMTADMIWGTLQRLDNLI